MTPKQRNYNGYSLVHPHTRTDPRNDLLKRLCEIERRMYNISVRKRKSFKFYRRLLVAIDKKCISTAGNIDLFSLSVLLPYFKPREVEIYSFIHLKVNYSYTRKYLRI